MKKVSGRRKIFWKQSGLRCCWWSSLKPLAGLEGVRCVKVNSLYRRLLRVGVPVGLILCLLQSAAFPVEQTNDLSAAEAKIKAGFLYNFAKLVEWPTNSFATTNSPLVIGILGDDSFGDALVQTVTNKLVAGRAIVLQRYRRPEDIRNCQILYIARTETNQMPAILKNLTGQGILTVSCADQFVERGGMIQLVKQKDVVRFAINTNATGRAGLRVSSRLLGLAINLRGRPMVTGGD